MTGVLGSLAAPTNPKETPECSGENWVTPNLVPVVISMGQEFWKCRAWPAGSGREGVFPAASGRLGAGGGDGVGGGRNRPWCSWGLG